MYFPNLRRNTGLNFVHNESWTRMNSNALSNGLESLIDIIEYYYLGPLQFNSYVPKQNSHLLTSSKQLNIYYLELIDWGLFTFPKVFRTNNLMSLPNPRLMVGETWQMELLWKAQIAFWFLCTKLSVPFENTLFVLRRHIKVVLKGIQLLRNIPLNISEHTWRALISEASDYSVQFDM